MDCLPCFFCDKKGAYYSYAEEKNYLINNYQEFFNGLERIIDPTINFRLFSGFKTIPN